MICATMEECWDPDAEARVTASCVLERFSEKSRSHQKLQLLIESDSDTTEKDHIDSIDSN